MTKAADVFIRCLDAIEAGALIERESRKDKEFHFQNWFRERLAETGLHFEQGGRNSYPDFRLVRFSEGYEVKGLAYPGRLEPQCRSGAPLPGLAFWESRHWCRRGRKRMICSNPS